MAKIRHIAYRAEDVDGMADFFVKALGMTIKQKRKNNAIDLSDGTVNGAPAGGRHAERRTEARGHRSHRLYGRE